MSPSWGSVIFFGSEASGWRILKPAGRVTEWGFPAGGGDWAAVLAPEMATARRKQIQEPICRVFTGGDYTVAAS